MALNIPTEGTRLNELKINIVDTQETFEAMKTANKVNANELYFIEQESSIAADSLKTGHTFKVNLASSNASSPFTGEQDISDIGVSGTLPITHGGTGATSAASAPWVQKSGDTMTGVLTMKGNMYNDAYDGALNMNNSDIYGLNSIYTADASDGAAEGIHFYRDATHVDTFWVSGGDLLFVPNRAIGTNTTKANSQKISRFTANPTSGQVVVTDGTTGGVKSSGYTIAKSVPSDAKFTDTTYSAGTGISLSGTEFSNSGVRATTINGNYLRVNTNGTDADLTIPYATNANKLIQNEITIQTGNTTQQHITLETLMTWLITTKQYIPSNTGCYKYLPISWAYANNDILQLSCNGTNYELQLAGCIIEFWGKATNYNTGVFRLGIHTNPSISFTANSGYTKFPASSYAEYTCNGSSYSPTWRMVTATSNSAPSLSWGASSTIGSVNGVNLTVTMPANPNTDTKVTSVDNHYAPTANVNSELTATLSGTAGNYAINTEYTVLTGVKAQRDAKGHITGLTYTAQKIKDTNTTYTLANLVGSTAIGSATKPVYWDGSKFAAITHSINKDVPSDAVFTDIKVTQNNTTAANDYRVLLSYNANDTTETNIVNKNTNLRYNPSTNTLSTGNISGAGNLTITGNANLNGETYTESVTAGSLLVNGNTNFVQIPTAPTPAITSNDTSIATTAFVKNNLGGLSGAMHFKGTTTTALNDGTTTAAVTIGGNSYTPSAGDVVLYSDSEFVWTGSAWERLGRDSSFKVQQNAVTTATTATGTTTTFVSSVTQDANGVITVTKQAMPTYNNYSLPLAASGTRGGIQIGYTQSGQNYPVQLSSEKAYVNVPWTDTKNTAGSTDTTSKIFLIGATSQADNPQTYSDSEIYVQNGTLYAVKAQDLSGTANNKPALIVGGADTSTHMELDANEIQAKTNGTSVAQLYINNDGGLVTIGSGGLAITSLTASQAVSTDANKKLVSTNLTVSDPTASGTGITYIATISQSATGKITATKSTVRSASTSQTGVTQYTEANTNTQLSTLTTTWTATPTDDTLFIRRDTGGGATFGQVKFSTLWNYIKGKITAGTYWANIKISDAAAYNTAPEMATLKLNGNTSATAASTSNVSLVYNSTTQALNFVFA